MQEAFAIANKQIKKSSGYNKLYYDKKVRQTEIVPGDKVLIRNLKERGGTGKLASYWERNIFEVVEKEKDLPVYKLKNLNKSSDRRVIHHNLLKKCNDLPLEIFQEKNEVSSKKKVALNRMKTAKPKDTSRG